MQALNRMLQILDVVADGGSATPVSVAEHTGLALSTVVRIMREMQSERLLTQLDGSHSYQLGPRIARLVTRASQVLDLRTIAQPVLQRLCAEIGETTALNMRQGDYRVCIAAAWATAPFARETPIGVPLPLAGSAVGHVLLASLPQSDREALLPEMERAAPHDLKLRERIDQTAARGWDRVVDLAPGYTGIAVPVGAGPGSAALSATGPSRRFDAAATDRALVLLRDAAASLAPYIH